MTQPGLDSTLKPTALVLRAAGTNCDAELIRAFELAGADPMLAHLDAVAQDASMIDRANIIALPGGFSYGDDIASGRIFALRVRLALADRLRAAVDRGACVLGICNGFQILVQAGLLPGENGPARTVTLTTNAEDRFTDTWVRVEPNADSPCIWTAGLHTLTDPALAILPIANGEGRFHADQATLDQLEANNHVALRYAEPVNGSARRIAGICDPTGRVLGLMPHPERYTDWNRHPFWTSLPAEKQQGIPPGLRLFQNAVDHARSTISATTASHHA